MNKSLILAAAVALALTACGQQKPAEPAKSAAPAPAAAPAAPPTTKPASPRPLALRKPRRVVGEVAAGVAGTGSGAA